MIRKLLLVLAGGFCGAITRYALSAPLLALTAALPGGRIGFPYDTLIINLSGSFAIGLLFGAFEHGAKLSPGLRLALGTGFLGAYTTFSSYVVGGSALLSRGALDAGMAYVFGSLAAGVALSALGFALSGWAIPMWRGVREWPSESDEELEDGGWVDSAPATTHVEGEATGDRPIGGGVRG